MFSDNRQLRAETGKSIFFRIQHKKKIWKYTLFDNFLEKFFGNKNSDTWHHLGVKLHFFYNKYGYVYDNILSGIVFQDKCFGHNIFIFETT